MCCKAKRWGTRRLGKVLMRARCPLHMRRSSDLSEQSSRPTRSTFKTASAAPLIRNPHPMSQLFAEPNVFRLFTSSFGGKSPTTRSRSDRHNASYSSRKRANSSWSIPYRGAHRCVRVRCSCGIVFVCCLFWKSRFALNGRSGGGYGCATPTMKPERVYESASLSLSLFLSGRPPKNLWCAFIKTAG